VVWEFIFLMLVLKIPIVYLILVVWWAVRAEPKPPEPAALPARVPPPDDRPWSPAGRRPRRAGPHGFPARGYRPGRAPGFVRAERAS
jgi:hypothetical protein